LLTPSQSGGGKALGFIVDALVTKDLEDTFKKIHDTLGMELISSSIWSEVFLQFIPF
jgi:hypothetical protein